MQKEKPTKPLSGSDFTPRQRKIAQNLELNLNAQSSDAASQANNVSGEVMWLRDLLPQFFPNVRIATYSYKSDWQQDVKTNIRKCGQQLLNVLYQHRSGTKVGTFWLNDFFFYQC